LIYIFFILGNICIVRTAFDVNIVFQKLNEENHKTDSTNESQCENHLNYYKNLHISKLCLKNLKGKSEFHREFSRLKDYLKLDKFTRKTHIDSLLKKVKSKIMKTIQEAVKACLNCKVDRIPQTFITNIKIDFNKKYINRTIYEIYQEFDLIPSFEKLEQSNCIRPEKFHLIKELLNMPFMQVVEFYLTSKCFKDDIRFIEAREGIALSTLFQFIAFIFIHYYLLSKGNKIKKLGNIEKGSKMMNIS
jgi:hypothetical protein